MTRATPINFTFTMDYKLTFSAAIRGHYVYKGTFTRSHILRGRSFEGGAHYKIFTSRGALIRGERSFEGGRSFEEIRYVLLIAANPSISPGRLP